MPRTKTFKGLKIKIEYTVEIKSQGELDVLVDHAITCGFGDHKTDKRTILKRLFQKKGEENRGMQPD